MQSQICQRFQINDFMFIIVTSLRHNINKDYNFINFLTLDKA